MRRRRCRRDRVGAISFDSALLAELGLSAVSFGDMNLAYETFVDDVNERGGINGRRLELTAEAYLPTTATEAEPLCIRLTEDIGVFAAFGSFLAGSVSANECIVGQHDTIMVGGVHTSAEFEAASAPWISSSMSLRRMYENGVHLLDDGGFLDDDPDIGIIVVVDEVGDVENALVPALEALGHDPTTYVLEIFLGDLIVAGGATDAVRQRMEADGIDLVLLAYSAIIRTPQDLLNAGRDGPASCAEVTLFEAVATAAGVDLTNESFRAAAEDLGEIEVPGVADASLVPHRFDADNSLRLVEWDSTVGSDGGVRSISDLHIDD